MTFDLVYFAFDLTYFVAFVLWAFMMNALIGVLVLVLAGHFTPTLKLGEKACRSTAWGSFWSISNWPPRVVLMLKAKFGK